MIQIDGIPRSMYGREPPLVSFGGTEIAGVGGPSAGPSNPSAAAVDDVAAAPAAAAAAAAGWGERLRSRREYTMLKKVVRLLQDNRVDTGDGETAQRLQEINQNQTDSYPILKTILNGLFITTGVVLLVGVVVVIIYTSLGSFSHHNHRHHLIITTNIATRSYIAITKRQCTTTTTLCNFGCLMMKTFIPS